MQANYTFGSPINGVSVKVAYTETAGTTAAISTLANVVRVVATTDCFIKIGTNPTAVADDDCYLPALVPEYFACPEGAKVSAVQVSAGGTLYVTPIA